MSDLSQMKYVKRVVVGSDNPSQMLSDAQIAEKQELLNRCLSDSPKGTILGIERSFSLLQIGEHQVVLQWLAYHVGFPRRPAWLRDAD